MNSAEMTPEPAPRWRPNPRRDGAPDCARDGDRCLAPLAPETVPRRRTESMPKWHIETAPLYTTLLYACATLRYSALLYACATQRYTALHCATLHYFRLSYSILFYIATTSRPHTRKAHQERTEQARNSLKYTRFNAEPLQAGRGFECHRGAASSAIGARHRAPSGRGIEHHRGTASSAIGARHRTPSGRGIERHRDAGSSAIGARVRAQTWALLRPPDGARTSAGMAPAAHLLVE